MEMTVRRVALVVTGTLLACESPPPSTDADRLARVEEMVVEVEEQFPEVHVVTVADVGRMLESGSVVLVDVREEKERAVSRIPGSITADDFQREPGRWEGKTVVAYCTIGHRSSEYAARLSTLGMPVSNLRGSILAWTHAGGPLIDEEGPTNKVHVYDRNWDLAHSRYETVW